VTKLSNCIDYRHWDARALTAVRKGNAWRIRSEFSVVSSDVIEYQAWDASAWRAKWDCDGFTITSSDGMRTYPSPTITYLGHVAGEQWQCVWQPEHGLFAHTRFG
jgi:hypothetical protein